MAVCVDRRAEVYRNTRSSQLRFILHGIFRPITPSWWEFSCVYLRLLGIHCRDCVLLTMQIAQTLFDDEGRNCQVLKRGAAAAESGKERIRTIVESCAAICLLKVPECLRRSHRSSPINVRWAASSLWHVMMRRASFEEELRLV